MSTPQTPTTGDEPRHATVADHVIDRMASWGVHRYYGYPGDGINGMTAALQRRTDDIRFIQVRHEETAGFAACAHVKYGGGPIGAALVTSGPGAVHLLNGLYDAKLDHQPVVALVGQTALSAQGGGYYQEVDLLALFKDVAGFLAQLDDPSQVRHLVDRACRTALAHRTVTVLVLPNDIQDVDAVVDPPHSHAHYATSNAPSSRSTVPPEADLRAAAELLRGGEKVAMLVGQGAYGAEAEVAAIAGRLGAGVATALLAMPVVDQREPWVTGSIGLLGTAPSYRLMNDCDRLLIVGSNMPYGEFYPPEGVPAVQIDIDGAQMGLRYPTRANLTGDAAPTLARLIELLGDHTPPTAWREEVAKGDRGVADGPAQGRPAEGGPGQPPARPDRARRPAARRRDARRRLRHRDRLVRPPPARAPGDDGEPVGHPALDGRRSPVRHRGEVRASRPATAGPARRRGDADERGQRAHHGGQVLAEWADPRFVLLVLNNRDLSFVSWEQRSAEGMPKFDESQLLPDVDYAGWARSLGLGGVRVEDPTQVGPAWDAALTADRPMVIDALVDPAELMIPPHFTLEQARETATSIVRGDSDWRGILRRGIPAAAATLLPHRG